MNTCKILIGGIRVSIDSADSLILNKAKEKMKRAGINTSTLHFRLYKKSVDARRRDDIRFECTVLAESDSLSAVSKDALKRADARILEEPDLEILRGSRE